MGLGLAMMPSASAEVGYYSYTHSWEAGNDAGGRSAVADGTGTLVDSDTFILPDNTNRETYSLGTPDGSGNISDGHDVSIQVCMNGLRVFHRSG